MFWAMYKWQIMMIYCISYIGFWKKSTSLYYKSVSRTTATYKVEHCMKNDEIRAFSNPHFPVFGQNRRKYELEKTGIWAYFTLWSSL